MLLVKGPTYCQLVRTASTDSGSVSSRVSSAEFATFVAATAIAMIRMCPLLSFFFSIAFKMPELTLRPDLVFIKAFRFLCWGARGGAPGKPPRSL